MSAPVSNPPMQDFSSAITAYRTSAANAFYNLHNRLHNAQPPNTPPKPPPPPFQRNITPSLQAYLSSAALKYATFKQTLPNPPPPSPPPTPKQKPRTLGASPNIPLPFPAHIRRQRYLTHLSILRHRVRTPRTIAPPPLPIPCGIPPDVRDRLRKRHVMCRRQQGGGIAGRRRNGVGWGRITLTPQKVGSFADVSYCSLTARTRVQPPSCFDHIVRCILSRSLGNTTLTPPRKPPHITNNPPPTDESIAAAVTRRYAGKPDEVYRRKTSRKYAAFRRRLRESQRAERRRTSHAENVMRQSRGHDQLLTHRRMGDDSFAPFLFDLHSGAYAFSSRISDAPKLRKAMIEKYSRLEGEGEIGNRLEKAQLAAETNPLFHTRVMNRFG